jgi:hypothetical protein
MKKTISVAALVMAAVTVLVMMVSYAWGMACPSTRGDEFTLLLQSVTVDGVPVENLEENMSDYYKPYRVAVTLRADIERSEITEAPIYANYVTLRFQSLVANYGSYDEIFRIDSGDR